MTAEGQDMVEAENNAIAQAIRRCNHYQESMEQIIGSKGIRSVYVQPSKKLSLSPKYDGFCKKLMTSGRVGIAKSKDDRGNLAMLTTSTGYSSGRRGSTGNDELTKSQARALLSRLYGNQIGDPSGGYAS